MKAITLNDFKELKKWRGWTKDEEKRLRQLFLEGKTDKEIGNLLGREEAAVQIRRSKIGATKWRVKKPAKKPVVPTGGAVKKEEDISLEALVATQRVLKSLGYRLAITKLEQ